MEPGGASRAVSGPLLMLSCRRLLSPPLPGAELGEFKLWINCLAPPHISMPLDGTCSILGAPWAPDVHLLLQLSPGTLLLRRGKTCSIGYFSFCMPGYLAVQRYQRSKDIAVMLSMKEPTARQLR